MKRIRIAIAGVGNCASSLLQGITFYSKNQQSSIGLAHPVIAGYKPDDIEVVAAFDVDRRKVNKLVSSAIYAAPNCAVPITPSIAPGISRDVRVRMGPVLDGVAAHMRSRASTNSFQLASAAPCHVVSVLKRSGADMMLNYLPVGAERATKFYAQCCVDAGIGFVNNIPVFIASDPVWEKRFRDRSLPLIGDDVKSQMGATIIHRALVRLCEERGIRITGTYQLNVGGNTDFLNMTDPRRLSTKRISKTRAIQSQLAVPLSPGDIYAGPSGHIPWLKDRKDGHIVLDGSGFAGVPVRVDVHLTVQDSPNSAGVVIDAIRCCKAALERRVGGALTAVSAYAMKHPPLSMSDEKAKERLDAFIAGTITR